MDGLHCVPSRLARRTEMTIEEIYDESIKPLAPSERFRLATLILSEIPPQSVVDIRDAWNEEDMRDISAYWEHHAKSPSNCVWCPSNAASHGSIRLSGMACP